MNIFRKSSVIKALEFRAIGIVGIFILVLSATAHAGEWTITPRIDLEQSVTDNARLVAENKEADLFTTATVGLAITGTGRRAQLNFNYDISEDRFWDNGDLDGFRQNLLGSGNAELVEDFVFVDTRASISQVSLRRNGGTSAVNRSVGTNDQSTVANFSLTPNFAHRYGNWADSDLRLSYTETRFLETDTGSASSQPDDSRSILIETLLRSGPRFTRFSWELSGSTTFSNNDSDRDITELSGEYAWSRHLTLLGGVGRETIENGGINQDDSAEYFLRAGARITPGPRSSFRLELSNRFGEINISSDANYQISSRTAITASYEVAFETDREALADNLNNLVLNDAGQLINPNTGQPGSPNDSQLDFLDQTTKQETFNIALNGSRGRNTFSIFSSVNIRTQLSDNASDTVIALGGNINRRIWPDLDGGISANVSAAPESISGVTDITYTGRAFLSYRIGDAFSSTLSYNYLHRDSDINLDDLQENVIALNLSKSF